MIRALGALLVFVSCSIYGFMKGQQFLQRLEELKEIQKLFLALMADIRFGQISLSESLERISGQVKPPFSRMLKNICGEMHWRGGRTMAEIWKKEADQCLKGCALNQKDRETFIGIGQQLGSLDRETQVQMIQLYLKDLEFTIGEIAGSIQEKQKLCRMFGIVLGLLLVILLL